MTCLWIFDFLCDLSEKLLRNHKLRSLSEFRLKFRSLGPHVDLRKCRLENLVIWIMLGTYFEGKINAFNQSCKWFWNRNQIPESESESKPGLLESELESESHDAGIGIRIGIKFFGKHWNRNQNRNHFFLESELESESWILVNPGIVIRIGISPSGIKIGVGIMTICNSGIRLVWGSHINPLHMLSPCWVDISLISHHNCN